MPTPLLLISDSPTAGSGLGRITRDLAVRIAQCLPEFRVGTLGYGGSFSRSLPFAQYQMERDNWEVLNLPEVWSDFAASEKGIVMTIWDASRMLWFSRPETASNPQLRKFLQGKPFSKWGYFPIDATGPNDRLTGILKHAIEGYDRVLAYSQWAQGVLERTGIKSDWLPHGIDTSVFYPRPRVQARHLFGTRLGAKNVRGKKVGQPVSIADDALLVGIVATNQIRKDWGLAMQTVAQLAEDRNVVVWCHTDVLERHWSLPALINDFGLTEKAIVTCVEYPDEVMAWAYSACDVTLGIGLGEGFGYPIFESMACGTPCIHGNYGGAAEHLPDWMLVHEPGWPEPENERIEGPYNCYRPVYDPSEWVSKIMALMNKSVLPKVTALPESLAWDVLWPRWADWLTKGLK